MSIEQGCWGTGYVEPVCVDERVACGFDELYVFHADALQLGGEDLGGLADVGFVGWVGRDGWDAQEGFQLFEEAGLVLLGEGDG